MPLDPCLLKYCWAGAKKIGQGWSFFAGASILLPPLLLLPAAVLAGAAIGDGVILTASLVIKRREAKKLAEAERKRKEQNERLVEQWRQAERARVAAIPPPPTRAQRAAESRKKLEETLAILDASGLGDVELQAARRRAQQLHLREIDGLMK